MNQITARFLDRFLCKWNLFYHIREASLNGVNRSIGRTAFNQLFKFRTKQCSRSLSRG